MFLIHIKELKLHKIAITLTGSWSCLGGPTQKNHAFKQLVNHRVLIPIPRPNITKT